MTMGKYTKELDKVLKEGIRRGQAETGVPTPITKEDREEIGAQIVASAWVKLWHFITFRGWK
jgi:hypothetical protein